MLVSCNCNIVNYLLLINMNDCGVIQQSGVVDTVAWVAEGVLEVENEAVATGVGECGYRVVCVVEDGW